MSAISNPLGRAKGAPPAFPAPPQALSERDWQDKVLATARWHGWAVYHTHDSRRSEPGFPDLVLCRPPHLLVVELKTDRGRASPISSSAGSTT